MQQRGDDEARPAVEGYYDTLARRSQWVRQALVLVPPALLQSALNQLARTDLDSHLAYLASVADYHEALKRIFFPAIFDDTTIQDVEWQHVPRHQFRDGRPSTWDRWDAAVLTGLTALSDGHPEQVDQGRLLNRQAVADRKPTVLVEIGENGRRDAAFVDAMVTGVNNLLRVLEMKPGRPLPPRADTRWFDGTASVNAATTGLFTPVASRGGMVRKGDPIGTVRSYEGQLLEEIVAPVDGYLMYGLAGPPVKAGESVATIALQAQVPL
jgi:Domain of unknown function (DUF3526)/Succinylglutamate desuccinylase / Aspartoacylase family